MITCNIDVQGKLLNFLKQLRFTNPKDIIKFAKTYTKIDGIISIDTLVDSFTDKQEDLKEFLQSVGVNTKETVKRAPKKVLSVSNIESNFTMVPVDSLFTTLHVAKQYFDQSSNHMIMSALYIGDPTNTKFPNTNKELNANINTLKNNLFKTIVDYLITKNVLVSGDYYTETEWDGKIIQKFNQNLYSPAGFNKAVYNAQYRKVMGLFETHMLGASGETAITLKASGRTIPNLKGNILKASDRAKFDAYNAAVLLLNFDSYLLKNYKGVIDLNQTVFNSFEAPLDGNKYFKKVKGLINEYWANDDLASDGVDKIQDKLSHKLVSMIPVYNKAGVTTGRFLEMRDLYGLGSLLQSFQTKNMLKLSAIEGWQTIEENPTEALMWYLEGIIKANDENFKGVLWEENQLPSSMYLPFRYKVDIAKSLYNFLNSIEEKEKSATSFSMSRIITQVLVNSIGATYSTDYGKRHLRTYKEMHTHNSERVQLQEGFYSHLKKSITNYEQLALTNEQIKEYVERPGGRGVYKLISKFLGINLANDSVRELMAEWSKQVDGEDEKVAAVVGVFKEIRDKIFPKYKDVTTTDLDGKVTIESKPVYEDSLFAKIEANENNVEELHFDDVVSTNDVISDLSKSPKVQDILDAKLDTMIVRILTTISKQGGEQIPTSVIPSLGQNDSSVLRERIRLEKDPGYTGTYRNYFTNQGGLLGTVIKLEAINEDEIKDASKYNVIENFVSHFEFDFLESFKNESESVNLMIGNYSDKGRILDKKIDKSVKWNDQFIIGKAPSESGTVMSANDIWAASNKQSINYYTDLMEKITGHYGALANLDPKFKKSYDSADTIDKRIESINKYLKTLTYEEFLEKTNSIKGVDFSEELHYSVYTIKKDDEKPKKIVALNQTLSDYYKIHTDPTHYEAFKANQKESFIHKLLDQKQNQNVLFTADRVDVISTIKKEHNPKLFNTILKMLGIDTIEYTAKFIDKDGNHKIYHTSKTGDVMLNPLVDKWLAVNEFFRNEYLYMTVKPEYMHPAKKSKYRAAKNVDIDTFLEEFNVESGMRLSMMAKRNVSYTGTTELPSRNARYGITDDVNVAVINDTQDELYNIDGDTDNVKVHDGATYLTYSYSKMIEHSFQGKGYTGTKKQLATFVTEFGSALKKDAEGTLTNNKIRSSKRSPINFRHKQEQTHSLPIVIDEFESGTVAGNNKFFADGAYFAINSYSIKNNVLSMVVSKYDPIAKAWIPQAEPRTSTVKNLFNIWEAFGGEYSVNDNFEFDESSNEGLFNLTVNYEVVDADKKVSYPLKNAMIHITSNQSAFKSGATNVHSSKYWTSAAPLKHTTFRNRNMGVQLDAGHDVTDSKMKEVTQLISALAQNPDTADQAMEMYSVLSNIVKQAAEKSYDILSKQITQEDLEKLYASLSRDLVKHLATSTNKGLAKTIAETFEYGKALPFSNQNFFTDFIKDLVTKMNRDFITRYYPGTGAVLIPSHKIVRVFENAAGEVFTQDELVTIAVKDYNQNRQDYVVLNLDGSERPITTDQILEKYTTKNFVDSLIHSSEVQIGDTVKVTVDVHFEGPLPQLDATAELIADTGEGYDMPVETLIVLDSLKAYYDFKRDHKDEMVFKVHNSVRDLKPIEITYDIVKVAEVPEGAEIITGLNTKQVKRNLFDADSVRLKFALRGNNASAVDKEIIRQFKEYFETDDETIIEKKLTIWTQRQLQLLSKGRALRDITDREFTSSDGTIDFAKYFGTDDLSSIIFDDYMSHYMKDSNSLIIANYTKKAAELILGNIYKDTFKTGRDTLAQVRQEGPAYFRNKLVDIYQFEEGVKADFKIATVGKENDVYVRFVEKGKLPAPNEQSLRRVLSIDYDEAGTLIKSRIGTTGEVLYQIPINSTLEISKEGYDILYIEAGEVKRDAIVKDTFQFVKDPSINKTVSTILRSFDSNIEGIVPILGNVWEKKDLPSIDFNSLTLSLFKKYSGYIRKTATKIDENYLQNNLEDILTQVSDRTFLSWEKSHSFVAARIPAQSMQSFMEMKNVGYFDTESNDAYVSVWQIFIQGSDFDIDKAYMMGYGFNKAGHFEVWNDLFDFSNRAELEAIEKMPVPSGKSVTSIDEKTAGVVDISAEFNALAQHLDQIEFAEDGKMLEQLAELILSNEEISISDFDATALDLMQKILNKTQNQAQVSIVYDYNDKSTVEFQNDLLNFYKRFIVGVVNKYNTSKFYNQKKFSSVNSVVNGIRNIISSPANQILANKPVQIDPLHRGANAALELKEEKTEKAIKQLRKDSNGGKDKLTPEFIESLEQILDVKIISKKGLNSVNDMITYAERITRLKSTLSAHDMLSMFKQQVDASVGKIDVGIGANGLKVMFALNSYYNDYYKSLHTEIVTDPDTGDTAKVLIDSTNTPVNFQNDPKWFKKTFDMGEPLGVVIKTAIADVNINNELKEQIIKGYGLEDLTDQLKIILNGEAALHASGFVSGATDNAKELIMAKINAIGDLSSMHLYLMTLGFTSEEVALYMNSDIATWVVKQINSTNVFDGSGSIFIPTLMTGYIESNPAQASLARTFLDIYEGSKEFSNLAGILKINQKVSADVENLFLFLNKINKDMYTRENTVLGKDLLRLQQGTDWDVLAQKISDAHPNNISVDHVLDVLKRASNIKVSYINAEGVTETKMTSMVGGKFDVRYYIYPGNTEYKKLAIEYYNLFKNTINVFDVLENSPHFKAMIEGLSATHNRALIVSKKYNFIFNTAVDIINSKSSELYANNKNTGSAVKSLFGNPALPIEITEKEVARLLRGYDGFLVGSWLKGADTSQYKFSVKQLLGQLNESSFQVYTDDNAKTAPLNKNNFVASVKKESGDDFIIDLTTDFGIANFKRMMENLVLPILTNSTKSGLGKNLRTKSVKNPYGLFTTQIVSTFGLSSLDSDVNIEKYQELLNQFNEVDIVSENKIKNIHGTEVRYQDLFYLYNLIVNNEAYGDNRLTPILQDYVKDPTTIGYQYLNYSREVDMRKIDIFKMEVDPTVINENEKESLLNKLIDGWKNDIVFLAYQKKGKLSLRRINNKKINEVSLQNSDFVINTFMDVVDNADIHKYSQFTSLLSLLRDSNLLIHFKCN